MVYFSLQLCRIAELATLSHLFIKILDKYIVLFWDIEDFA